MLNLDLPTVTFLVGCISVLQAGVLMLYYFVAPHYRGIHLWALAGIANAVAYVLLVLRGQISDALSIVAANGLLMLSTALLLHGTNLFLERPRPRQAVFAAVLSVGTVLAFLPLTYVTPSIVARTVLISLAQMVLFGLVAANLLRDIPAELQLARRFTGTLLACYAVWLGLRAALTVAVAPLQTLFAPSLVQTLAFLLPTVVIVAWTAGSIGMTIQRLLLELRQAQSSERSALESTARDAARRAGTTRAVLDVLIEHAPIGVAFLDQHLALGAVNARLQAAAGLRRTEPPASAPASAIVELARGVLASGAPAELEFVEAANAPAEQTHTWQVSAYPVPFDGQVVGVGVIAADVTTARRAEAVLRDANALLEREVAARTAELVAANVALAERETMLRAIGDNLPDAVVYQLVRQPDGRQFFSYVSAGVERISGVTPAQVYADPTLLRTMPSTADQDRYAAAVRQSAETLETFEFELAKRLPNNEQRWSQLRSQPRRGADGSTIWDGIEIDITARKKAEQALRARIDELLALNRIAQALTTWTDVTHGLESVGTVLRALFDADWINVWLYEPMEGTLVRLIALGDVVDTEERRVPLALTEMGRQSLTQPTAQIVSLPAADPLHGGASSNGRARERNWLVVPLRARNEPVGILCIHPAQRGRVYPPSDVALAQTIAGVLASALENAMLFTQAKLLAAEGERRRLARELHDSVSQALFAANRTAEVLPQLWELDPEEAAEALADLQRLTGGALAEMRALLIELRPNALAHTPLHETLAYIAPVTTSKSGVTIETSFDPTPLLPADVQVGLYRMTQEALNNIGKHAHARHVKVLLETAPAYNGAGAWSGSVTITIADDGRGFNAAEVRQGRMGLTSMRERAADIGATFQLASQPGAGTAITVAWRGAAIDSPRSKL